MPHSTIITDEIMGDAPFATGEFDARMGLPAMAESYFSHHDCIVHYCMGYASVTGSTEGLEGILALYDSPEIHKNWTMLHWQIAYTDTKPIIWHWIREEEAQDKLREAGLDGVLAMDMMRSKPGEALPLTSVVSMRYEVPQESVNEQG